MAQRRVRWKLEKKDKTKLCNKFVQGKYCRFEKQCRYTHKKICQELLELGICRIENCKDGHNIDGVCKNYNNKEHCKYNPCRYVHIKLNSTHGKRKNRAKELNDAEIIQYHGQHKDRKDDDNDNDDELNEPREDNTQRSEERAGAKDVAAIYQRNEDSNNDNKTENTPPSNRIPDRGLIDFLWMDLKRDIWKEEKELEMKIQKLREMSKEGKLEDQNLYRTN